MAAYPVKPRKASGWTWPALRPEAPETASLASRTTISGPAAPLSTSENAVKAPEIPLPIMTYFEDSGSAAVASALRYGKALVVLCQYDKQQSGRGSVVSMVVLVVVLGIAVNERLIL